MGRWQPGLFLLFFLPTLIWLAGLYLNVPWWLENMASLTALPLLGYVLLMALLLLRRRMVAALCCLPFVTFWADKHPLASVSGHQHCVPTLSVFQYNRYYANPDIAPLIAHLDQHDYDLVALQEVSPLHAHALSRHLAGRYPYRFDRATLGYFNGQLVLSRQPLFHLPTKGKRIIQGLWQPQDHPPVVLYTAHLPSPKSDGLWLQRNRLLSLIEQAIEQERVPARLIVGDFNLSASSVRYHSLFDGFHSEPVPSWPSLTGVVSPFSIAIDHLWASPPLKICQRQALVELTGSDHRAVVTRLAFVGAGGN